MKVFLDPQEVRTILAGLKLLDRDFLLPVEAEAIDSVSQKLKARLRQYTDRRRKIKERMAG